MTFFLRAKVYFWGGGSKIGVFIGLFEDFRVQKFFEKKLAGVMLSDKLTVPSR